MNTEYTIAFQNLAGNHPLTATQFTITSTTQNKRHTAVQATKKSEYIWELALPRRNQHIQLRRKYISDVIDIAIHYAHTEQDTQ